MKAVLITLAALAGLGAVAGGSVVAFGLYNVSAQAGHLPAVGWVLHTTFRNSVSLRAPSMADAPDLDDPDLVALGAGHYATACLPCHAAPGQQRTATSTAMVPEPPHISEAIAHWEPNELHWIVENGAKMTGMPGWPARQRGDEVWAVVAYLEAIRETGPAPDTAALAEVTDPRAYCATCHENVAGPVPRLDLLPADYLEAQMRAYASGLRPSGIMEQAMSRVDGDDIAALAAEMAALRVRYDNPADPGTADETGRALAMQGTRDVPACTACHGPDRDAGPAPGRAGPAIRGQNAAYLAQQLDLWRDGIRTGSPLMEAAARDLTDAQIDALSRWFAQQAPAPDN